MAENDNKESDVVTSSLEPERSAADEQATEGSEFVAEEEDSLEQTADFLTMLSKEHIVDTDSLAKDADELFKSRISFSRKALLVVVMVVVALGSLFLGRYDISPAELIYCAGTGGAKIWTFFTAAIADPNLWARWNEIDFTPGERVFWLIRFPRIAVVILVGAALAVAGASYQGMFKNPLTSPDLLGASAGASLGACLALLWNMGGTWVQILAFVGGLLAVGLTVALNKMVDYDPTLSLVLAGILVGTLFQSAMSIVKLTADANDKLPEITFWLMGSFHDIQFQDLAIAIPMIIGFVILIRQAWKLNVLSFGDEEARAMGVNTSRTRLWVIFAATLVTSASVAVAGIVGWIGLVVPHLARAVVGPNYKQLLPASMFAGAAFLLIVDNVARLVLAVEIPIGLLTSILGVPFFMFIFKRNMKGW